MRNRRQPHQHPAPEPVSDASAGGNRGATGPDTSDVTIDVTSSRTAPGRRRRRSRTARTADAEADHQMYRDHRRALPDHVARAASPASPLGPFHRPHGGRQVTRLVDPALGRVQVCPLLGWDLGLGADRRRLRWGSRGDRRSEPGVSGLSGDGEVSVERLEVADGGGSPVRLQCSAQHADAFLST